MKPIQNYDFTRYYQDVLLVLWQTVLHVEFWLGNFMQRPHILWNNGWTSHWNVCYETMFWRSDSDWKCCGKGVVITASKRPSGIPLK